MSTGKYILFLTKTETDKLLYLSISSSKSNEIELCEAMSGNGHLCLFVEAIITNDWSKIVDNVHNYKHNSFSFKNCLLFRGNYLFVPSSLCKSILDELHLSHPGIVKMKSIVCVVV
ncbi:unnamed protein product [Lepeophtheirus salmonis]|uniref:(salmon louse) hypothetical protein n=1 Tax=Lepeophtheirus salmonis TaxID=72036 RepID=A0A7R8D0C8_LEPSM|nr:unnamed protein product [Lepeophtheirus salmonis]CAF2982625.1 unnamed protein product [Lepeophtheirus salmonis]